MSTENHPVSADCDAALEQAATTLDDLALTLMTTSDENPEGNSLTAAVVTKCAQIVRQHKAPTVTSPGGLGS